MKNIFVLLLLFLIMTISLEANLRHLPIIPLIIIKPPTPPTPCPKEPNWSTIQKKKNLNVNIPSKNN